MYLRFHSENFKAICNKLARLDKDLYFIIKQHGHPPMWTRTNSFATLIHIILEQQVSLASARAAFYKLKKRIGTITAQKIITLSDSEMKSCYFSRQKTIYARHLAEAVISKQVNLKKYSLLDDETIRAQLKEIKGIGDWTVDVYLLFALQRTNIFPTGDLAMMNALKEVKKLPLHTTKEKIIKISEKWQPYRSIATMLLWHYYIQKKGIKI
jgi:DNA-3-methyladenine glycosylase II